MLLYICVINQSSCHRRSGMGGGGEPKNQKTFEHSGNSLLGSHTNYFCCISSRYICVQPRKNIKRNNSLTYKTLELQTENCTHRNLCFDFWTDLYLPSLYTNGLWTWLFFRSVVLLGLPSLPLDISGTIYWSWYYNQLLRAGKCVQINVSDRNPKINLVVSMQLVNKMMGVHKGHLL